MRYLKNEPVFIASSFETSTNVRINIYNLTTNDQVVSNEPCVEIDSSGVYFYKFTPETEGHYFWEMFSEDMEKTGLFIVGGYPDQINNKLDSVLYSSREFGVFDLKSIKNAKALFQGDIGVRLEIDVNIPADNITASKLIVKKPSGVMVEWITSPVSGTTQIAYTTEEGDLDEVGVYSAQAYIETNTQKVHGEIFNFLVKKPL